MNSKPQNVPFPDASRAERDRIEGRCAELIDALVHETSVIKESISYCVLGGGKRLRPVLCLWTHDFLNGAYRDACMDVACAIECLHTYSLVHDDLPCMDDDDLRRGKPSCHKKFGEAIAVLTGDGLLTLCFEILTSMGERRAIPSWMIAETSRVIAEAAGTGGLITGQLLDLQGEAGSGGQDDRGLALVDTIHEHKTAKLIAASMEAGAICAEADREARRDIRTAGLKAGQAFQIVDDILDIQTDPAPLGKTPGKDVRQGKLTYPSVAGVQASRERAATLIAEAKASLERIGTSAPLFSAMDFILNRTA